MHAILSIGRPVALGAPESIAILIILLVFFSAPVMPADGHAKDVCSRLTRGEKRFLVCLGVVLAVLVVVLVAPGLRR